MTLNDFKRHIMANSHHKYVIRASVKAQSGFVISHFTIILSMLLGISKLLVFVYSISPLPLTQLIMLFSCIDYLCGSEFVARHLTGSDPIFPTSILRQVFT